MASQLALVSILVSAALVALSIPSYVERLRAYGGLPRILGMLSRPGPGSLSRFFGDFALQGGFFKWGGEPVVEGVFRGLALYILALSALLSLAASAYSLLSGEIPAALLSLASALGLALLLIGLAILWGMRPRREGRSWLLGIAGLDLLYLALIPLAGLLSALGILWGPSILLVLPTASALVLLTPRTRFWYNIASALNALLREPRHPGKLPTPFKLSELGAEELEKVRVGLSTPGELGPLELINLDSCANCGLCDSVCPAYAVGRPLSPRLVVLTLRDAARRDPGKPVVDLMADDTFWSCTTCGACVKICPMGVDHVPFIVDVRRSLVFSSRIDQKKAALISNIAQSGNSMGVPNTGRHEWVSKLGVPALDPGREGGAAGYDYVLWLGCMGSFDQRARRVVESFLDLLGRAGIRVAVLGDLETCCGDPLRRLGEESRFQDLALRNIEIFKRLGVRRIVTICPHGFNTFKNEYKELDPSFDVEVFHHSQILSRLVEEGRLRVEARLDTPITIHDSCYIARINGIVEEPRRALRISSKEIREPRRAGTRTFCCGAGGANYWYDVPERKRISVERAVELASTGAGVVAAECPFCIAMLEDALRNLGLDKKIGVADVSEILRGGGQP